MFVAVAVPQTTERVQRTTQGLLNNGGDFPLSPQSTPCFIRVPLLWLLDQSCVPGDQVGFSGSGALLCINAAGASFQDG